ncbi:hypothetical protein ACFQU7_02740 [Pseudoroseomonas wenyumeiae]
MLAEPRLNLAQDLCARLCHDLVGPLGTVAGAVEMVTEDPEAAELAREAAASLRGRLQLWRAACGAGTGPMTPPDLAALLDGNLAGGRASPALGALPPGDPLPPRWRNCCWWPPCWAARPCRAAAWCACCRRKAAWPCAPRAAC